MDARTQAWLDQEDSRMKDMVRQHGWAIEYIGGGACTVPGCESCDDEVAFAYTVGLFGLGHPELLVFGLGMEEAGALLNGLATRVPRGRGHHSRPVDQLRRVAAEAGGRDRSQSRGDRVLGQPVLSASR